jgi:RND family efflux transporter MFP subunit
MRTTAFRRFPHLIELGAVLLGLWLLSGCEKAQSAPPPPQVTVAPAISRPIADEAEFTGHFQAVNSVEIRPRVSGFVERVAFTEGAVVHQGDVLFTIDARPYEAEVARAEAVLEQARTRKQLADMELERAQRLVATQAISREELDARTSERAESEAAIRAAEAALRIAKLNLEWTAVRAPITGRVSRAEVTQGNLVQAGPGASTLLTTVVSLDPIYVYFDTDEQAYLKYLRGSGAGSERQPIGTPVYVGLATESGFPHEGRLDCSHQDCLRGFASWMGRPGRWSWSRIVRSAPIRIGSSCSCSMPITRLPTDRSRLGASSTDSAPWSRG